MNRLFVALAVVVLAAGPAVASDRTDVMTHVRHFVDSFNKGDTKAAAAACADETSIIDEFPPYGWHGAGACTKWMDDYDADAKKNEITDGAVTLGNPRHVDITADRAYVVVPASYTYKKKGKLVKETGSMFTLVLQRDKEGWRVTGWTWAKN